MCATILVKTISVLVSVALSQKQIINQQRLLRAKVIGLHLYCKSIAFFMILTINGQQVALKKGASIEYVWIKMAMRLSRFLASSSQHSTFTFFQRTVYSQEKSQQANSLIGFFSRDD